MAGHLSQVVEALVEAHAQIGAAQQHGGAALRALGSDADGLPGVYEELSAAEELATTSAFTMAEATGTGAAAGLHTWADTLRQLSETLTETSSELTRIRAEVEASLDPGSV